MRPAVLLLVVVGLTAAGCGRRENPSAVDAKPAAPVAGDEAKPLPAGALQVRWGKVTFPRSVDSDTIVPLALTMTNAGDAPWPDKASASPKKDGSFAVRVTHTWLRADDPQGGRVGAQRTDLSQPLMPGASVDVPLSIRTPATAGEYRLVIELVQELVQWFADLGADRITLPVQVVPAGRTPAGTTAGR